MLYELGAGIVKKLNGITTVGLLSSSLLELICKAATEL